MVFALGGDERLAVITGAAPFGHSWVLRENAKTITKFLLVGPLLEQLEHPALVLIVRIEVHERGIDALARFRYVHLACRT